MYTVYLSCIHLLTYLYTIELECKHDICLYTIVVYNAFRPLRPSQDNAEQRLYRAKKDSLFEQWAGWGYLLPQTKYWSNHNQDHKITMVSLCMRVLSTPLLEFPIFHVVYFLSIVKPEMN